ACRLAFGPGRAGIIDDHAAQEAFAARTIQADGEVAAVCPAAGQETDAVAAGRAPELQCVADVVEALDDRIRSGWLGVADGITVDDPAIAPDAVAAAGASVGTGAHGDGRIDLDRSQARCSQRYREQMVSRRFAASLQMRTEGWECNGSQGGKHCH